MGDVDFSFQLPPGGKTRFPAGPYDRDTGKPHYTLEASVPGHAKHMVEFRSVLQGSEGHYTWVWEIDNRSTWPAFIIARKDGALQKLSGAATFEYRVYYEWQGPSVSDPFAAEKSAEDIEAALREFPNELRQRLRDHTPTIETKPGSTTSEVILAVTTRDSRDVVEAALTATLQSWRLFGKPI